MVGPDGGRYVGGQHAPAAVREDEVAGIDLHLARAAASAFDDVCGPDRYALGNPSRPHETLLKRPPDA
jgi:hypothetical protein